MVTVVTSVSIMPPTGDNVVETHSKVSVPPLGLASGGFMHQTFCPVLIVSKSYPPAGELCVIDALPSLGLALLICKSVVSKISSHLDIIGYGPAKDRLSPLPHLPHPNCPGPLVSPASRTAGDTE